MIALTETKVAAIETKVVGLKTKVFAFETMIAVFATMVAESKTLVRPTFLRNVSIGRKMTLPTLSLLTRKYITIINKLAGIKIINEII
ncbi:MAG: hypothetical protein LBR28_04985 [Bacteroidales bacterium]|jgi:hypothetical protein|nr:hypothetical protein [Bacteroidales bacterium]